jgi:hypothetical protein
LPGGDILAESLLDGQDNAGVTDAQVAIAKAASAPANAGNTRSAAPFLEGMLKANAERRKLEAMKPAERTDQLHKNFSKAR